MVLRAARPDVRRRCDRHRPEGADHFYSLGIEYPIRQAAFAICSIIAMFVASKTYQAIFVVVGVIYQITWILRLFDVLN
jgi:hypothetical protein